MKKGEGILTANQHVFAVRPFHSTNLSTVFLCSLGTTAQLFFFWAPLQKVWC